MKLSGFSWKEKLFHDVSSRFSGSAWAFVALRDVSVVWAATLQLGAEANTKRIKRIKSKEKQRKAKLYNNILYVVLVSFVFFLVSFVFFVFVLRG